MAVFPSAIPSIPTSYQPPFPAFSTSTTKHAKTRPLQATAEPGASSIPDSANRGSGGGGGLSGGAVAGLVIGALIILIGSVVGGFMLLKKRRKRLMVSGRGYNAGAGYPEATNNNRSISKREIIEDDDDDEKLGGGNGGGLAGLFSGLFGQTRKVVRGGGGNRGIVQSRSVTAAGPGSPTGSRRQQQSWAMTPTGATLNSSTGEPLLRGMDQQQPHQYQQQQHQQQQQQLQQARMASPSPSFPTHQSGSLPPSGHLVLPGAQPVVVSGYAGGHGYSPAGMNPFVQPQQVVSPEQRITAPASQPYVYQPGTGLVSVPSVMPPMHHQQQQPNPYQQQQQPVQYPAQPIAQYEPTPFQPPAPGASPIPSNLVRNAWPVTAVAHSLAPAQNQQYQQQQQQQQYQPQQQQQQQQQHQQQQHPMVFPPPPPAASVRAPTPESASVFLPGDASRPLLGQGLFKIVPDSEDDEEAARVRAAVAAAATAAATDDHQRPASRASVPLDLNLGGDFLSSVLNYENQDQRFQSLRAMSERTQDQQPLRPVTPSVEDMANTMTSEEFEEYKRTPGYHDRLAGQKDRPKNQPRYLVDKEEIVNGQKANLHIRDDSEIVIVGSDVVLEPLPSAKAAAAAASESGSARATPSPYHPSQQRQSYPKGTTDSGAQSPSQAQQTPRTSLTRQATLGEFLPTIGTEEYLERTDDKEEYSFGIHGDASSSVDGGASTVATPLIHHPATRIAPAAGAALLQADGFSPPVSPASFATTEAYRPMTDLSRPSIIDSPSPSSQVLTSPSIGNAPPSLARSTKPKFK